MKLLNCEVKKQTIYIKYEECNREITFISNDIVNISDGLKGSFKVNKKELIKKVNIDVERINDEIVIKTLKLIIKVRDGMVDIYDLDLNELCVNYTGKQVLSVNRDDVFSIAAEEGHKFGEVQDEASFKLLFKTNNSKFYGLGERAGFLEKSGYEYINYNTDDPSPHTDQYKQLYKSVGFLITKNQNNIYGIFLDNTYKSFFDMCYSSKEYYSISSVKGSLDYYFINGKTMKDIVKNYTYITGVYPLPQMWTLGYQQCRWSYKTQEEVMEVVNNYIKHKIPCDVIYLDIDYMQDYKVFTIDKNKFPDFKGMIIKLKELGFKIVCIIDPGVKVEKGYSIYEEGVKNNYFAVDQNGEIYVNRVWPGDSVFPSFTNNEVQEWWALNVKQLVDLGVSGIWNDMNEPASFNGPLPDNVVFKGNKCNHLHEEVHNVYGHYMSKATYEGLVKYDKKRPFVITRAAFAGTQKYSTVWTGDNNSIWSHLQLVIPQLCNLGMSGMPFCGTDIGGFGGNTTKELLIRWVQAAVFSPLFRNHSSYGTRRQEPWMFDQETIDLYRSAVELRYRFLPYIYDLFYQHQETGLPIMRPLILHYEDDENVYNMNDQFLVGENILVSPVLTPGTTKKMVYIPKGKWYDYYTKQRVENGYFVYDSPLNKLPIFVKEGIVPEFDLKQNVINHDTLYLNVFGKGEYIHYQDNNTDFKFKEKEYNVYKFKYNKELSVTMKHEGYTKYKEIKIKE